MPVRSATRMDFTDCYKQSGSLVAFSPGAQFILTAIQDRLVVRRSVSFQVSRSWTIDSSQSQSILFPRPKASSADNSISSIGWSTDSEYILAASAKKGVVHIFKLRDDTWSARIDSGAEGLARAEWAPDGRSVLCFSEWGVSRYYNPHAPPPQLAQISCG